MTAIALVLVVLTLLVVLWLGVQVLRLRQRVEAVPADGNVFDSLRRLDTDLAAAESAIADIGPRVDTIEATLPLAIRHTGVVSYDAFGNIAGNMSRSIALLNGRGDGVVISLLVGRDETRWFTKMVSNGGGAEPLSPEEKAAIRSALSR